MRYNTDKSNTIQHNPIFALYDFSPKRADFTRKEDNVMKTKAVRIHGKMDLRLDEIELPEVGPDDVQVKVISDSICMAK